MDSFILPASTYNPATITQATASAPETWRKNHNDPEFDDLYDVTDDESSEADSEIIALACSASVKKSAKPKKSRYPSIVIPSPSAWPTIEKLQKGLTSAVAPHPISMIAASRLQVPIPTRSSTPSLDGSLTSEEMDKLSCPGTPRSRCQSPSVEWAGAPFQLSAAALQTLHQISETEPSSVSEPVIELDARETQEMQEVTRNFTRNAAVDTTFTSIDNGDNQDELLSALSVPSPGGFFSSLDGSARNAWSVPPEEAAPTTSAAENFYHLPWTSDVPVTRTIELPSPASSGPSTARQTTFSQDETVVDEIRTTTLEFEYNEEYQKELELISSANIGRTSQWLKAQDNYLATIRGLESGSDTASQKAYSHDGSNDGSTSSVGSPSKKSVRFVEPSVVKRTTETATSEKDTLFLEGFQQIRERSHQSDVFVLARTRAEAIHTSRRCLPRAHCDRLMGKFRTSGPLHSAPKRPISNFYAEDPSLKNDIIAQAQKERQVIEQIQPNIWSLDALKTMHGGRLVSAPAVKFLTRKTSKPVRVLDLAGPTDCNWAWQMAMDFPSAEVYNITIGNGASSIKGPVNYHTISTPNLWTLPFPSAHFDVISARTLHTMLKLHKTSTSSTDANNLDEYDLCLRECHRLLKRGGFLEYNVLDAEMVCPRESIPVHAQALAVEFAFNLRTRGYDSQPTSKFMSRLSHAGFDNAKRSWMVLPVPQLFASEESEKTPTEATHTVSGSTADASCIAGLVGAEAWERWMLKLQIEMGKDEERLLEGVGKALEEASKARSGWRCLSGWARKGF